MANKVRGSTRALDAHTEHSKLQVRTIHPRPGKTVISVFRSVHRATVLLYLMLQEIIEQMTAAAKKRQIEIPIGCGSLAECTARSYVSRTSCNISSSLLQPKPSTLSIASRADPYTKACHHALRRLLPRARLPPPSLRSLNLALTLCGSSCARREAFANEPRPSAASRGKPC